MDRFLDFQCAMAMEELNYVCKEYVPAMEMRQMSKPEIFIRNAVCTIGRALWKAITFVGTKIVELYKTLGRSVKSAIQKLKRKNPRDDTRNNNKGSGNDASGNGTAASATHVSTHQYDGIPEEAFSNAMHALSELMTASTTFNKISATESVFAALRNGDLSKVEDDINDSRDSIIDNCVNAINSCDIVDIDHNTKVIPQDELNGDFNRLSRWTDEMVNKWQDIVKKHEGNWSFLNDNNFQENAGEEVVKTLKSISAALQDLSSKCLKASNTVSSYINDNIITVVYHMETSGSGTNITSTEYIRK
jgi:hypothetical protein